MSEFAFGALVKNLNIKTLRAAPIMNHSNDNYKEGLTEEELKEIYNWVRLHPLKISLFVSANSGN